MPGAKLRFDFRYDPSPRRQPRRRGAGGRPAAAFAFRWGDDELRFELEPDGDGTLLTLTDTFDERGKAARDAAGWHVCLLLLAYDVDGRTPPEGTNDLWKQVNPLYVEKFGPEASTLGPPEV